MHPVLNHRQVFRAERKPEFQVSSGSKTSCSLSPVHAIRRIVLKTEVKLSLQVPAAPFPRQQTCIVHTISVAFALARSATQLYTNKPNFNPQMSRTAIIVKVEVSTNLPSGFSRLLGHLRAGCKQAKLTCSGRQEPLHDGVHKTETNARARTHVCFLTIIVIGVRFNAGSTKSVSL